MRIVNAQWKLSNPIPGATYTIKGTGPGTAPNQINIPPTVATLVGTDVVEINNVAATNPFETDKVKFYNSFDIAWQVSVNGAPYESAGRSDNPVYVCLRGPDAAGRPIPYRTVVEVACATDGAANADQAVTNTWSRLSGPSNLLGWDETTQKWRRKLYYYKPGTTFADNVFGAAGHLLQAINSSGQCSTWAMLLYDAIRLNGASAVYIVAEANDAGIAQFLVKDWTPNAFAGWKTFRFGGPNIDMIPKPKVGGVDSEIYGAFTNKDTLKGQNSRAKAPSQKVFQNHQFLKYTPVGGGAIVYYDASYGVTYTGELNFQQNAVDGLAQFGGLMGGFWEMDVKQTPAANSMMFREFLLPY